MVYRPPWQKFPVRLWLVLPGGPFFMGYSWPGVFLLRASGRTGRFFTQLLFHDPISISLWSSFLELYATGIVYYVSMICHVSFSLFVSKPSAWLEASRTQGLCVSCWDKLRFSYWIPWPCFAVWITVFLQIPLETLNALTLGRTAKFIPPPWYKGRGGGGVWMEPLPVVFDMLRYFETILPLVESLWSS